MAGGPSEAVFLKALNGGRRVGILHQRDWAVSGGCLHGSRFGVFPSWDDCLLMETLEMRLPPCRKIFTRARVRMSFW